MWKERKNSVAIQSYSAKSNQHEPEENKRVSNLDFYCKSADIRPREEIMWTPAHAIPEWRERGC